MSLKEAVAQTHPVRPSMQARSRNSVWQHSGQPQTGPRPRRHNPRRHSASTEPYRGATVKPPPSSSTHTSATSRRSGTIRDGRRSPNSFSDSFRLVRGTRYTTSVPTIRTAIAGILKERFTEEIIVVRSVKRRVDKTSWWFTVMAPPDTLESLIILGDLNADPGPSGGPLSTTPVNEQGRILLCYLSKWNFASVHLHVCSSPISHTYVSEAHNSHGTIDHILAPGHLIESFSRCFIIEDEPLNLSDHSPVCASLKVNISATLHQLATSRYRPNWAKLSNDELLSGYTSAVDGYTSAVDAHLSGLPLPSISSLTSCPTLIDTLPDQVTDILHTVTRNHVPAKRYRPFVKPGWTPELKQHHSMSKILYKEWVKAGRPRSCLNQKRKRYKDAKAAFRPLLRKHQRDQRDIFFRSLDLEFNDTGRLFRLVRRAHGGAAEPTTVLTVGGHSFEGNMIPEAWADYFADLASPPNLDHDPEFSRSIEQQFHAICSLSMGEFVLFSEEEVAEVLNSLKRNKAAGPDELDLEHLRFGGEQLVKVLTLLFNSVVLAGHILSSFRHGLVIPIPKGHNKDLTNPSNYRGITILSNVSKLLEKLVIWRISELNPPPTLNPLQGSFIIGHSCSHTALILQEAISSIREAGSKAYVAFLDVKKAFYTVWHAGLLVKLHQKGVTGHLWRLINSWYTSSSSCVLWNGTRSSSFVLKQGVRQGGTLFPFLYVLFVDELLDNLSASRLGCTSVASTVARRCTLMIWRWSPPLHLTRRQCSTWSTSMLRNGTTKLMRQKSVIMVFGEATVTRRREWHTMRWTLGEAPLKEVDEIHHLGILRTVAVSTVARTNERASACRSAFFALNSIGSRFGCLHPLTSLKLYKTVYSYMAQKFETIQRLSYSSWKESTVESSGLSRVFHYVVTPPSSPNCWILAQLMTSSHSDP